MTNREKLRTMTDEELAAMLQGGICDLITAEYCKKYLDCRQCTIDWLRREAEE